MMRMGAFLIILRPKGVECTLLRVGRCAGGMDRAPFERAMHAFMRTVLLRGGGMNALMLNAEP
jgi:hypothetical protein